MGKITKQELSIVLQNQISTEIQTKVDTHADLKNNPHAVTKSQVGLGNVDNTSDANKPISTATQTAFVVTKIMELINSSPSTLDTLNELATALGNDPNFATTVSTQIGAKYTKPTSGIPKTDLESGVQGSLSKADTALQSVTKTDIGLGNVDNTSDLNKPISTATQTALNAKLTATQATVQVDSTATDITTLVNDFNSLLGKLRTAGILAN